MTSDTTRNQDDVFSRPATDEERANVRLPTEEELREALAEGERQRAAFESLAGAAVAPRVLFK